MKKAALIIVIIALVCVLGLSMTACNRATTQGQLANLLTDHNSETFVYDVKDSAHPDQSGSYTVNLQLYAKGDTIQNFGNSTLENVDKGVLVSSDFIFGEVRYKMGCYFNLISGNSFMVPAYTYRVQTENGNETFRMQGSYDGATLRYDRYIDGVKSSGAIKASGTYFDNNEFQQSLRTVTTFSSSFSFGFSVPLVSEDETANVNLTAACTAVTDVETPYRTDAIKCYCINLSRSTQVKGISQQLYYATDNLTYNGWELKNVLVKIVEPYKIDHTEYKIECLLKQATLA